MARDKLVIRVPSSHLYRGMRLRAGLEEGVRCRELGPQQDSEVLLLFQDGSYAAADLFRGEEGWTALRVDAYTTTRGTRLDARVWRVKGIVELDDGLDIHLGD